MINNHTSHNIFVGNCKDTANWAKDTYNDGCEWYDENPRGCGKYDDGDFKSNDMCCACGGISTDLQIILSCKLFKAKKTVFIDD